MIGPPEIMILALVIFLFFGPKMLTNLARSAGETKKEIDKITKDFK